MPMHRTFTPFLAAAILAATCCASANAQHSTLSNRHVPRIVADGQAKPISPLDGSKRLSIGISLPLRNEAELDALLADIYDPQSPRYRQYLSVDEFTQRFAPTAEDYAVVQGWANAKDFTIVNTPRNRLLIDLQGSAATVQAAFGIKLNTYQDAVSKRTFFAPDREPVLDMAIPVLAITGLTDVHPPRPHYGKAADLNGLNHASTDIVKNGTDTPHITGSGPGDTYLPSDMRAAYYGSGSLNGAGQTVAIFSFDGYNSSDLQLYYKSTGTSTTVPVSNVLVAGYNGACFGFNSNGTINPDTCDDGEQILDIVNVIGMAPGLKQVLFYEGESATSVLNQIASDNTAKVISSSWGGGDFGDASDPAFKQFQAQGQSYMNATGDSGAFDGFDFAPPSADPNITQVGATILETNGKAGPWASETGWPNSGGGFDSSEPIPNYQELVGVINSLNQGSTTLRNAPDVAAEGDFDNTTVIDGVFESGFGGTSFAAPRWAGYIALANQQSMAAGKGTLGFLNPSIYNIGVSSTYATNFHDILSGNNAPSDGSGPGFNAVKGYDLVTGWGSPNGASLLNSLGSIGKTPGYSLFTTPGSVSIVQGGKGTVAIGVLPLDGFAGNVSFSVSGLPKGVTAALSPVSSVTGSTITFTVSLTADVVNTAVTIQGTSGTMSKTTTLALSITAVPTSQQILLNTGFETGPVTAPWTTTPGVPCTLSCGETPHAGSWYAWLDGYGKAHTDTLSQSFSIAAAEKTASLSFFLHVDTAETTKSNKNDTFTIQLLNPSGSVLTTLGVFSNLDAATGYVQHIYPLDAYVGKSLILKFTGKENSSLQTSFVVDDVTVTVNSKVSP